MSRNQARLGKGQERRRSGGLTLHLRGSSCLKSDLLEPQGLPNWKGGDGKGGLRIMNDSDCFGTGEGLKIQSIVARGR